MKIHPAGAELFLAEGWQEGRMDRHDEANSCFSQVYEHTLKGCCFITKNYIPPNAAQSFVRELSPVHRFVLIVSIAFSEAIVCVGN
jgi:hypothetical protein